MRIGITGIAGRMGRLLAEEIAAAGATLAGGTIRPGSTKPAPEGAALLPDGACAICPLPPVFGLSYGHSPLGFGALP